MSTAYTDLDKTAYPNKLDTYNSSPGLNEQYSESLVDNVNMLDIVDADDINALKDGILAIQRALGLMPYDTYSDVAAAITTFNIKLSNRLHTGVGENLPKIDRNQIDITSASMISGTILPTSDSDTTPIETALNNKVNTSDVVTSPLANKILKLNANAQWNTDTIPLYQIPYMQMLIAH